jgi:hypothetical protein
MVETLSFVACISPSIDVQPVGSTRVLSTID